MSCCRASKAMSDRETFGPRLRSERERRGISLETIASVTKVGAELWDGLERNDFSRWPTGIFARAFVRDYARAVGLDADEVVDEFCRLFAVGDRRAERMIKAHGALIGHDVALDGSGVRRPATAAPGPPSPGAGEGPPHPPRPARCRRRDRHGCRAVRGDRCFDAVQHRLLDDRRRRRPGVLRRLHRRARLHPRHHGRSTPSASGCRPGSPCRIAARTPSTCDVYVLRATCS